MAERRRPGHAGAWVGVWSNVGVVWIFSEIRPGRLCWLVHGLAACAHLCPGTYGGTRADRRLVPHVGRRIALASLGGWSVTWRKLVCEVRPLTFACALTGRPTSGSRSPRCRTSHQLNRRAKCRLQDISIRPCRVFLRFYHECLSIPRILGPQHSSHLRTYRASTVTRQKRC
ncbi:hypothetical protein BC628DRAFT_1348174 [Trametes gibbosa]|nr:hypothetical protein BC628DRAFT_1348174 [Trametes gibbosa]